jgi:very-short-patch-repair endonuclease
VSVFRPCPKLGKRPSKPRKPIPRSPIKKRKGSAKNCDNGKRIPRRDPVEVRAWAVQKRLEKLQDISPAQLAIGAILRDYGVDFKYEHIWDNADFPYFSDIYIPSIKMTVECDGKFHLDQKKSDTGKALYIARNFGVGTVRIWNEECLNETKARQRVAEMLGVKITETHPSSTAPSASPPPRCSRNGGKRI